jgi:3-carboxy-cis,cis-muconate cycloisomerase
VTRYLDPLFRTDAMVAIFSDQGRLQGMLDFEAALARAQASTGVIPKNAAPLIGAQCQADFFDMDGLARAAALAGNPAIPMVKALTDRVAQNDEQAAGFVHWGATSQDAMDTGLVLQLRSALALIDADLARLSDVLANVALEHSKTPMAGRTWLQQAVPITFGLKIAGALSAMERHRARLRELRARVLVVQFGGAAGTLAALGAQGAEVCNALASELKLANPDMPWHAHRDRVAEVATVLGLLTGTLGKMARDLALLMQTGIEEVLAPDTPGKGGSSSMPQKRNPVDAALVLSAAIRVPALVSVMLSAMVQEHERGLGTWHAEWETLPEICMLCSGALAYMTHAIEGLHVDTQRMRENLHGSGGMIVAEAVSVALARKIGRAAAHEIIEAAARRAIEQKASLLDVLKNDAKVRQHLSAAELERLLDASGYLGAAEAFVARVLAARSKKDIA